MQLEYLTISGQMKMATYHRLANLDKSFKLGKSYRFVRIETRVGG